MHIDPWLTDAFNALISGGKWWVSLPKDLYEFKDEFMCDSLCSDVPDNFHRLIGVWFIHILPQIRYYILLNSIEMGLTYCISKCVHLAAVILEINFQFLAYM